MTLRIGHGVDAHRFVAGRALMLGGVHVPHDRGLLGHSDGDAVSHALADAVLGAAGLGDLGAHFPSSDPRWRNADSLDLLRRSAAMVAQAGFTLVSAQVVAVAEVPRLAPYVAAMAHALIEALGSDPGSIAVSATSSDGLGFVGRGEGVAASAVALLSSLS